MIDIGDALDKRIKGYSGGMKRRLDLAAALIHNPDVLFLDEPTTGLDPVSRAKVWEEVRRLNTELGTTIFLTTQYLEEADVLADRVGIIDHGKIVAEGTPADLKRSIGSDLIIVTVDDADAASRAVSPAAGGRFGRCPRRRGDDRDQQRPGDGLARRRRAGQCQREGPGADAARADPGRRLPDPDR